MPLARLIGTARLSLRNRATSHREQPRRSRKQLHVRLRTATLAWRNSHCRFEEEQPTSLEEATSLVREPRHALEEPARRSRQQPLSPRGGTPVVEGTAMTRSDGNSHVASRRQPRRSCRGTATSLQEQPRLLEERQPRLARGGYNHVRLRGGTAYRRSRGTAYVARGNSHAAIEEEHATSLEGRHSHRRSRGTGHVSLPRKEQPRLSLRGNQPLRFARPEQPRPLEESPCSRNSLRSLEEQPHVARGQPRRSSEEQPRSLREQPRPPEEQPSSAGTAHVARGTATLVVRRNKPRRSMEISHVRSEGTSPRSARGTARFVSRNSLSYVPPRIHAAPSLSDLVYSRLARVSQDHATSAPLSERISPPSIYLPSSPMLARSVQLIALRFRHSQ
ncbi:hypothetical protein C7M84_020644 [Penaeus vannamei]|uniref:Uncharacterized protein n=1 Tax=Penaeus vannamei TaxID=6689 RepID=A0A3R7NLQ1_PENVA|nr:hypothetical protein C7M84_020644 [Penaeus vannamei]